MSQTDGERVIAELNGTQVQNRPLRVNEANERPPRSGGGGGGGGGGRGGYLSGGGGGYRDRGDRDRGDDRGGDRDRF